MTAQKKDNKGFHFPNTNKTKATQPDYTGKSTVDGKEWQTATWENTTPDGKRYLSTTYSIPLPPKEGANSNAKPANGGNSTTQNTPQVKNGTASPIFEDTDDLDAILRSADDDNPFN